MSDIDTSFPSMRTCGFRPRTLNAAVDWPSLLRWLDIQNDSRTLPAGVICPFCRSPQAKIIQDQAVGGQWYACPGCQWAGDLVEFAAAVWKIGVPATVARLAQLGVPWHDEQLTEGSVRKYEARHIAARQRLRALWDGAQKEQLLLKKPDLGRLLSRLHLRTEWQGDRWLTGPGAMIAWMTKKAVEQAIHPGSARQGGHTAYKGKYANDPSQARLFRGSGWDALVALPYYDVPGRIATLRLYGREGRVPDDEVSKTINYGSIGPAQPPPDAGLAFHPQVPKVAADARMLVCVDDPLLMLRMQWKAFRMSYSPLPIAAWVDDGHARTSWAWDQWHGQRLIFWSFELTARLLRQLVEQNAEIALVRPPSTETLTQYLCHHPVQDLFRRVKRHAKPWQEALARLLSDDGPAVRDLLGEYQLIGGDVDVLLDKLPGRPRETAARILFPGGERRRVITSFDNPIVETAEGWHEQQRNGQSRLVCDAVLRIEHVFAKDDHRNSMYAGRILYQGRELSFCEDRKIVAENTVEWMQQKLLDAQYGFMQWDSKYARWLFQFAVSFHRPEFHDSLPRIGWDRETFSFVLPRTIIRDNGEVQRTDPPWLADDTPAMNLAQPDALFPSQLWDATRDTPAHRAFWAVFAALTANVIAPSLGRRTCGLALVGHGAHVLGEAVARLFGCLFTPLADATAKLERSHGWPLFVRITRQQLKPLIRWLSIDVEERQCIAPLDAWKAAAVQLNGHWRAIELDDLFVLPPELMAAAPLLLPAYLQDVCQRKFVLANGRDYLTEITNDLAEWAVRWAANGSLIASSRDLVRGEDDEGVLAAFGDFLARLVLSREVECVPPDFARKLDDRTIIRLETEDERPAGVLVTWKLLESALQRHHAPIGDLQRILDIVGRGPLIEEGDIDGKDGLLLDAKWWTTTVHRHRSAKARLLEVVG